MPGTKTKDTKCDFFIEAHFMRILITGGAGFIGSHLAEYYLKNGDEVHIIDDLSTGSRENIAFLKENPDYASRLHVTIDTILNFDRTKDIVDQCDAVVHLAAAVGVNYILEHPLQSLKTNIQGTDNILRACAESDKWVLIASSSEVYGKHSHAPLLETDNIIYGPSDTFRWSYGTSKLVGEFTSLAYYRSTGLKVTIVRLFNTVGPRQSPNYGMVIPRLVSQALSGEPLTVYGDGNQTRTFTYIDDVIWALSQLAHKESTAGQVYNIGGEEEVSIFDLAQKILTISQSPSEITLVPYETAYGDNYEDIPRRVPGIAKIRKSIGYHPQTSLQQILEHTIRYMRSGMPKGVKN